MQTVTRDQIREKLNAWRSHSISTDEIQAWASERWMSDLFDYEDWEREDFSVSNEILAAIDMLDLNLITSEDADIFLDFLSTPIGEFPAGYNRMKERLKSIDYEARKVSLRGIAPYAPFIK